MTAMLDWAAPDGVEILIAWLTPLGETRDVRPAGGVLPYRMVECHGGPDDRLVERGVYMVHTFAATKPQAQAEATLTHRRIQLLSGNFVGQQKVTISTGDVYVDNVVTIEKPHWVQWDSNNTIHRCVASYRMDLRFIAA